MLATRLLGGGGGGLPPISSYISPYISLWRRRLLGGGGGGLALLERRCATLLPRREGPRASTLAIRRGPLRRALLLGGEGFRFLRGHLRLLLRLLRLVEQLLILLDLGLDLLDLRLELALLA